MYVCVCASVRSGKSDSAFGPYWSEKCATDIGGTAGDGGWVLVGLDRMRRGASKCIQSGDSRVESFRVVYRFS